LRFIETDNGFIGDKNEWVFFLSREPPLRKEGIEVAK
jgi:hypothetical protein